MKILQFYLKEVFIKQLKESLKKKPRSQMSLHGQAYMPTYFFYY